MTASQTTTATISNAFNAFFSLEDLETRLAEYIGDNLIYCELTDTMQLANDCDTYDFIDHRDRSTTITGLIDEIEKLSQCDSCNHYMHEEANYVTIGYNNVICQSCYEDSYFTCDACNEVIHNDDYGRNGYCESCYQDRDATQFDHVHVTKYPRFHDFKLTPAGNAHPATPSGLNYAIGIEIEAYGDYESEYDFHADEQNFADELGNAIREVWNSQNIIYDLHRSVIEYKDDTSLQEDDDPKTRASFEADISPLRIETWRTIWTKPEVLAAYSQLVKKTTGSCGLHISIGSNHAFPVIVYTRINCLMRALEDNEEKARAILGRKPSAYPNNACRPINDLIDNWKHGGCKTGPLALRKKARRASHPLTYLADHEQQQIQGRFEFRAFRAPMQNDLILRRIEYAVSMVEWSKAYIHGFYAMNYRDLINSFEQFHADRLATTTK